LAVISIQADPPAAFLCLLSGEALAKLRRLLFAEGWMPTLPFCVLIQEAPLKVTTSPLT
jgi:hypothetical protein